MTALTRGGVVIATQFANSLRGERRTVGMDSRPAHIREVAETSLKRQKLIARFFILPILRRDGQAGGNPDPAA